MPKEKNKDKRRKDEYSQKRELKGKALDDARKMFEKAVRKKDKHCLEICLKMGMRNNQNHSVATWRGGISRVTGTLLSISAHENLLHFIPVLLENGFEVNYFRGHEHSALGMACMAQHEEMVRPVRLLLALDGIILNEDREDYFRLPICILAEHQQWNLVDLLIEHGADVNHLNCFARLLVSYLQEREVENATSRARNILQRGARLEVPIANAIVRNDDDALYLLLQSTDPLTARTPLRAFRSKHSIDFDNVRPNLPLAKFARLSVLNTRICVATHFFLQCRLCSLLCSSSIDSVVVESIAVHLSVLPSKLLCEPLFPQGLLQAIAKSACQRPIQQQTLPQFVRSIRCLTDEELSMAHSALIPCLFAVTEMMQASKSQLISIPCRNIGEFVSYISGDETRRGVDGVED